MRTDRVGPTEATVSDGAAVPEEEVPAEGLVSSSFPVAGRAAGQLHSFWTRIGPNRDNRDRVLFVYPGLVFGTTPRVVLVQPRQNENIDHGWPDQFAIQVLETGGSASQSYVKIRIRRIDTGSNAPAGWGQDLRVDFLVVE